MAATLGEVRAALASTLEDAMPGVNIYAFPVDEISAPAIMVAGFRIDPGTLGDITLRFEAELYLIASHRHIDQLQLLDEMASPAGSRSVWSAIDSDPSLGEVVGHATVETIEDYRQMVVAEVGYYAATARIRGML
jgi:hypothetical protein